MRPARLRNPKLILIAVACCFVYATAICQDSGQGPQPLCGPFAMAFAVDYLDLVPPAETFLQGTDYHSNRGTTLDNLERFANKCGAYTLTVRGRTIDLLPLLNRDTVAINIEPNHFTVILNRMNTYYRIDPSKGSICKMAEPKKDQIFSFLLVSRNKLSVRPSHRLFGNDWDVLTMISGVAVAVILLLGARYCSRKRT